VGFLARQWCLSILCQHDICVNPIDQHRPQTRPCDQTNVPAQILKLTAHGAPNAAAIWCGEDYLAIWQQAVGKEPAGLLVGELERQQAALLGEPCKMLTEQADEIVRRTSPVAKPKIFARCEVIEEHIVVGRSLLNERARHRKCGGIGKSARRPACYYMRQPAILEPRIHMFTNALETIITDALWWDDGKPVCKSALRTGDYKSPTRFSRIDDCLKHICIG
jgi:hypothetical protein